MPPGQPVGTDAKYIISADLNNDGKRDVITASYFDNNISILIGNGDGSFQPEVNYPVGPYPTGLAAGDFNGDGIQDLAVANAVDPHSTVVCNECGTEGVSVLLGNGDGTFQPAIYYTAASGTAWVSVADMNHDGKLDIIAAAWNAGAISVLLGNGDGTFQAPLSHTVGKVPHSLAVADLNGDGILDLGVANYYSSTVEVLIGNGDGTFTTGITYPVGLTPHSICYGDFNNDGTIDLATANVNGGSVTVLLGNGDGTFKPGTTYTTGIGTTSVYTGDFNGDGKLDIVAANSGSLSLGPTVRGDLTTHPSNVSILLSNGDGTFQPPVNYSTGAGGNGVVVDTFNSDSFLDLAVSYYQGYVKVLLGNGQGAF